MGKFRSLVILSLALPAMTANAQTAPPAQPPSPPPPPVPSFADEVRDAGPAILGPPSAQPSYQTPRNPPLGFAGLSGIASLETQDDPHFVPVEDRWRVGFPDWDRYGKGHPAVDDYPYVKGNWWDPFNQNVLKGDLSDPRAEHLSGGDRQHGGTGRAAADSRGHHAVREHRQSGQQGLFRQPQPDPVFAIFLSVAGPVPRRRRPSSPVDWRIKLTPAFNVNYLVGERIGPVVSPNVDEGAEPGPVVRHLERMVRRNQAGRPRAEL